MNFIKINNSPKGEKFKENGHMLVGLIFPTMSGESKKAAEEMDIDMSDENKFYISHGSFMFTVLNLDDPEKVLDIVKDNEGYFPLDKVISFDKKDCEEIEL
jgi:hypothetical protein